MSDPEIPIHTPVETTLPEPRQGRLARFMGRMARKQNVDDELGVPIEDSDALKVPNAPDAPEDYKAEMSAWTDMLNVELASATSTSEELSAKAERYFSLLSKLNQTIMGGREWLNDGDLVRKGVHKRYDPHGDLYASTADLSKQARRLSKQLDYAKNFNQVLEFADEIDPSIYRRFIPEPNQLGEAFNLPRTDAPTTDPEVAAAQLARLPFINWLAVRETTERKHPSIVINGHFDFPTERVIGVSSFQSWAGRGEMILTNGKPSFIDNGKGGKGFKPYSLPDVERTSRGAITDYAQVEYIPDQGYVSEAQIVIIQDAAGEYWGIATTDGSHRMAAAKLRGEPTVTVASIEINSDEDMHRLGYAVKDVFGF